MKRIIASVIIAGVFTTVPALVVMNNALAEWAGVDETVVEKFARDAGREPREPYINTDKGDLLLFVFLVGGVIGGFVMGYYYHQLFPPKGRRLDNTGNV